MKSKKVFGLLAVLAIVAVAYNVSINSNGNDLSDVSLANIEALAQESGGSGNSCGYAAYEYDNDWYEDTKNFRRCGDCQWVTGTQPKYTQC